MFAGFAIKPSERRPLQSWSAWCVAGMVAAPLAATQAHASSFAPLFNFANSATGENDISGLSFLGGKLYGVAASGGASGHGTVFGFDLTAGKESTVYSFTNGAADGGSPESPLSVLDSVLYGTTLSGTGVTGGGAVFGVDPASGSETLLHGFSGTGTGFQPYASLTYGDGFFYGTTPYGGVSNNGTIYQVSPSGAYTVLYQFPSVANGSFPDSKVVVQAGVLYGTTNNGGANNNGVVYSFNLATGTETVLHTFEAGPAQPEPGELTYYQGSLYGHAENGGAQGYGYLYKIDLASGAYSVVHTFSGTDGAYPTAGVVALNGLLYGTTTEGGTSASNVGAGTIFSLDPSTNILKTVYDFTGGADASTPFSDLLVHDGSLYGESQNLKIFGNEYSVIYKFTP